MALKKPTKATASAKPNPTSTKEKGDLFEKEVADVFRLMPGAAVTPHKKIAGKDVDIYVVMKSLFSGETKIAIDTKDYVKQLNRAEADAELSSYRPLIDDKHVDQFMLVTRHGIGANAKEIFNGKTTTHFTISDLQRLVFDPSRLIDDMEYQFSSEELNRYYVNTMCYDIDIEAVFGKYDLYYNEFIAFSISGYHSDFDAAKKAWKSTGNRQLSITRKYTKTTFRAALDFRRRSEKVTELEPLIEKWLENSSLNIGIALLGTYGTGKSSFARRIAHKAAVNYKLGRSKRIPLLIELKKFSSHQSIDGLITHTLVNNHGVTGGSYTLFEKMNASGNFFLVLDGFDEMKQGMTKDALIYNFSQLNSLCQGRARVLLCGRPTMFESEEEQTSMLSGRTSLDVSAHARYIPINIAPLHVDTIMKMMVGYVKAREPKQAGSFIKRAGDMKAEIKKSSELTTLLSRPVHVPMFVTILPEYKGNIAELKRAFLYEAFIKRIISREFKRLHQIYQLRYSTDQRFQFAEALAFEMVKAGEHLSIRRSEIPASIVLPFVNEGDTVEIAKRDLLTAGFLEQKPPDILSFAHKSFLEFLTASYSLRIIRGSTQETASALIYPTREIASFFIDLIDQKDIDGTLDNQPDGSWDFLFACLLRLTANHGNFITGKFLVMTTEKAFSIFERIFSSDTLEKAISVPWPEKNRKEFFVMLLRALFAITGKRRAVRLYLAKSDDDRIAWARSTLAEMKKNNRNIIDQTLAIADNTLNKFERAFLKIVSASANGPSAASSEFNSSSILAGNTNNMRISNEPFKAVLPKAT